MAITLSNTGITSGSVVKSAEISQSIDAFTGVVAYDIHQSGSFNTTGSTVLSGSVFLPDNTHIGIGTEPSAVAGVKLALKANDSSNDPTILIEGFSGVDSATVGWKNPDVRWNLGLNGGSIPIGGTEDGFFLQNQTTNKLPVLIDYSSSDASIVLRNDNGTDIAQRVGINWPYQNLDPTTTVHHLNISGSATSSVGFYGKLFGTASLATKVKTNLAIQNGVMPFIVNVDANPGGNDLMFKPDQIYLSNQTDPFIQTTTISSSNAIGLHGTASWAVNALNAGEGLWSDQSTYISSSTKVSASVFLGAKFEGDNFTGSTYTGTKFSGSEVALVNDAGTSAATLKTTSLLFEQNSAANVYNSSTSAGSRLSLGLGNPATVGNTHLIISGSGTKGVQIPNGPLWISTDSNQGAGNVSQVVGSSDNYIKFTEFFGDTTVSANATNIDIWDYVVGQASGPLPSNLTAGVFKFTANIFITNRITAGAQNDESATIRIEKSYRLTGPTTTTLSQMTSGTSGTQDIQEFCSSGLTNFSIGFEQFSGGQIYLRCDEGDGETLNVRGTMTTEFSKVLQFNP